MASDSGEKKIKGYFSFPLCFFLCVLLEQQGQLFWQDLKSSGDKSSKKIPCYEAKLWISESAVG